MVLVTRLSPPLLLLRRNRSSASARSPTQILAPLMTMNTHGVLVTPIIAANTIKSDVAETTKTTTTTTTTTKPTAKTGNNCAAQSSAKKDNSKDDVQMDKSSTDGSVLNEENMTDLEELGNSFAVISAVANVSSFALTDVFMSNFDFQTNEESSATAPESHMDHASDVHISGDETSKIDELNDVNADAKASLSLCPIGLVLVKKIQNAVSDGPLKTLFDPGSDKTSLNRRVLPKGVNGKTVNTLAVNALNGTDKITQKAVLEGLTPPEFSATQRMDKRASARVFDQPDSPCDLVFGLDLLVPPGIDISCLTQTMTWSDESVSWKAKSCFDDANLEDPVSYETHCFFVNSSDDFHEWIELHSTSAVDIKGSKHEQVDTDHAAKQQMHLMPEQQIELAEV